jgi:hypothetical protein
MNDSLVDTQAIALLRRLAREQEMRTRRLRDEAAEQARDIVRRARSEARARVHQAIVEARREGDLAVARRQAAIETGARRTRQATLRRLLDDAWQRMPGALAARWENPEHRRHWCEAACAQALRSLLQVDRLMVRVDARWREELAPLIERCLPVRAPDAAPAIAGVPNLGPGLTIRGGQACLDATVTGLLAARDRIAAELLAEIDREWRERDGAPS